VNKDNPNIKRLLKNFFLKFSSYILSVITKRKKFSKKINKTAVEKKKTKPLHQSYEPQAALHTQNHQN